MFALHLPVTISLQHFAKMHNKFGKEFRVPVAGGGWLEGSCWGKDDDVQRRCSLKTFSQFELFEPRDKQQEKQGKGV